LRRGSVVFSDSTSPSLKAILLAHGATQVKFHCADRVASSSAEKKGLFRQFGADAVEMESAAIEQECAARSIPCATVRVILDTADQDLPLDFNPLMTANYRLNYIKLAKTLLKNPEVIPSLLFFQKQCQQAARKLAGVLKEIIESLDRA
jgi:nucleoside phosphorylase